METVEDGWNVLVGPDHGKIVDMIKRFEGAGDRNNMLGKGDAGERILEMLRRFNVKFC